MIFVYKNQSSSVKKVGEGDFDGANIKKEFCSISCYNLLIDYLYKKFAIFLKISHYKKLGYYGF